MSVGTTAGAPYGAPLPATSVFSRSNCNAYFRLGAVLTILLVEGRHPHRSPRTLNTIRGARLGSAADRAESTFAGGWVSGRVATAVETKKPTFLGAFCKDWRREWDRITFDPTPSNRCRKPAGQVSFQCFPNHSRRKPCRSTFGHAHRWARGGVALRPPDRSGAPGGHCLVKLAPDSSAARQD